MFWQPTSLQEAVRLLADEGGTLVAGGTDVFPALVDRPSPAGLIDLTRCAELKGIAIGADAIRIGAGSRWSEIARASLPRGLAALQAAAREVGSVQIQNSGTIGGNLCNASPAADGVPPLLALDAAVELVGSHGLRRLGVGDFVLGNRRTARATDEILSAIWIPRRLEAGGSAFLKLGARRYMVISIVMVAVTLVPGPDGRIADARVAVGAASAAAQRLGGLEARLVGTDPVGSAPDDLVTVADVAGLSPIDDVRASAAYRLDAARELVGRAILQAWEAARA
ncbi:FAD binding domain-containing protein [Prosthecomicrobium hirschii]|uniref:FAD binding domain-containing protein n=1 Tax=Prosthecodimorpha hirschii TaxID=665126 RepID=UPI00221F8C80|nr:FAD binding domain-containing protein [Prosthecomicrobium hirschii]MCW1843670.1 FAD binding domain-containing protein [Prosthecomicrobium hirschii]